MSSFQFRHRFISAAALPIVASVILLGPPLGTCQTIDSKLSHTKSKTSIDVSLGVFGQLTRTRTPGTSLRDEYGSLTTQTTQGTSPSAGVLGTLHQSFRPWLGYNVNLGYTRFSENYSQGSAYVPSKSSPSGPWSSFSQGSIGTNMYELTIASVFEGPRNGRFSTFGQFGGGGLFFLPTQTLSPANKQIRPAMIFGVGMNYRLTNRLDIRAEYRGLFYKSPDFAYSLGGFPMTKLFTVTNTPAVSLVYRFGGRNKFTDTMRPH